MKSTRRFLPLLSATAIFLALSSCNRGIGCPTNLSVEELVSGLLALIA